MDSPWENKKSKCPLRILKNAVEIVSASVNLLQ